MQRVSRGRVSGIVSVVAFVTCLGAAGTATASEKIGANASNVSLKVDANGRAVVYYTSAGKRYHPVVWGAVNARRPSATVPQVTFKVDYSGGYMKLGYPLWKTIKNRCRPYDGPRLPWFVAGCKAPDGSYWALQRFQRLLPNLGLNPWLPKHRAKELHVSHFTGAPAKLDVYADWVMSSRTHEVFGQLTYRGNPVHGIKASPSGVPLDGYGRLIYLDVYNAVDPAYPRGWSRENSFLARKPNGHFCYGFFTRDRYPGYPAGPRRGPANGDQYRLTAGGPGVTPFVQRVLQGLPDYDKANPALVAHEEAMNEVKRQVVPADATCAGN